MDSVNFASLLKFAILLYVSVTLFNLNLSCTLLLYTLASFVAKSLTQATISVPEVKVHC